MGAQEIFYITDLSAMLVGGASGMGGSGGDASGGLQPVVAWREEVRGMRWWRRQRFVVHATVAAR